MTVSKLLLMTTAMTLLHSAAASAEEGRDAVRASDDIVVTAQKREQRLIDVPFTVTAITGEDLKARNIQTVQDLSFAVPGVVLRADGPGSMQIFMRGIGNLAGSDALVAVYQDETPVTLNGSFRQLDLRALDMARVEVLKGPQGTLYGQGATAGTVRFVTNKPKLDVTEGSVDGEMSFIDGGAAATKLTGIVNLPIVDGKLAVRVAATLENGGGWIDQPEAGIKNGNNQDLYSIRAKVLFKPNEWLELLGTVQAYRNKSRFGLDYEEKDRTNEVGVDRGLILPPRDDRYQLYNLTATADLGPATLTSSTSYIDLERDYHLTYIAGPQTVYGVQNEGYDINNDHSTQFTQEVRVASNGSGPLRYTVGGFYRDVKSDFYDVGVNAFAGVNYPYIYINNESSKSWSVFADVSYDITEAFQIGAGARRFRDRARQSDGTVEQRGTFRSTDPRFYASYSLNDDWRVYANVAKGFRSGGFNRNGLPRFSPEKAWNYEIGTKGVTADGLLTFDIAAYYTDFSDQLRRGLFYDPGSLGGVLINRTSNIGKVEIKGIEAGVVVKPIRTLSLSGSASYVDSKVKSLNLTAGETIAVQKGDRSDYVPKFSFTLAADSDFDWTPTVAGFAHVDFSYRSKVYYTDDFLYLPQFRRQSSDSVGLLGARIGARFDRVSAELFANNILNTNKALDPFVGFSQANRTKPRTIGVRLGMTLN
ncbi:TonB-dependent receptor [Sphingomonas sp. SRS2]|uniref:TonB-dependent receptor n=1 Tax=Sphingomonas sp. SRS2 TaxID=133190 RepID=UPI0006183F06|nr:TonB-dependent receptor [Sphingomonas sp. SRS2]KKC26065.1 hypothetical protein WP12_10680 [Sphingomonas sp. SRS2]